MASKRTISTEEAEGLGATLGVDWTKIPVEQFRRGLEVELEHGAHDPDTFTAPGSALAKAVYSDILIGFVADQAAKHLGDWSNFTKSSTTN